MVTGDDLTRSLSPFHPLLPGDPRSFGSYEVCGSLMAPEVRPGWERPNVFVALDPQGRHVVVKAARRESGSEGMTRLRREARNATLVRSQHVATVLQGPREQGRYLYIVQEFVEGIALDQLLERKHEQRLDDPDVLRLARGLLRALRAMSRAGVTHRDIKPANIIVDAHGPVVIDFGISHHAHDDRITFQGGQRWGTPRYMSPEQFEGRCVTPAIDIFAWAITIVEAATGRHPFDPDGTHPDWEKVNGVGTPFLDGTPPVLAQALRSALIPDLAERRDAATLERFLSGREVTYTRTRASGDIPLAPVPPFKLALPGLGRLQELWTTAESVLGDGHRGFLIACGCVAALGVPSGVVLRILVTLVFG